MNLLRVIRENWTDLADAVADRDDIAKGLASEAIQVFGVLLADVDTYRSHRAHGIGMYFSRLATSTEGEDTITTQMLHDPFSHLRAGAIVGTKKQNTHWLTNMRSVVNDAIACVQHGVKCRTGSEV